MDEGKERTRTGEKERALEAYQKAHDLMKVPTTGMTLVKAHLALGHLIEARDVALEVARMPRERSEPGIFEKARKEAKELEASLKPRIPTVRIVVKGGPATHVTVDDVDVAPLLLGEPVAMNPGKHTIVAKNADNVEKRADVDLAERDAKEIELTLPVPNPVLLVTVPPPAKGRSRGPAWSRALGRRERPRVRRLRAGRGRARGRWRHGRAHAGRGRYREDPVRQRYL